MTAYCGVDPGLSGGIAWIDGDIVHMTPMPSTEYEIKAEFSAMAPDSFKIFAVIEQVHSMPKQGVRSAFTFGQNYGFLRGMLVATKDISFQEMKPQAWQRSLGLRTRKTKETTTAWKTYLLNAAMNMFPRAPWLKTKKARFAVADALLIAECARRTWTGLK